MATALDYPPLPGIWVQRAQDALDALSAMATIEEVAEGFGTARALVEAVLGSPVAGGVGTRRVVRATGALLTHRLSPALAAEALSWAASVAEMVSTTAIEEFLEAAADSEFACQPRRLDDRYLLNEHLGQCRTDAARRSELGWWWRWRADHLGYPPEPAALSDDLYGASLNWLFDDDPHGWSADTEVGEHPVRPHGPTRPTAADVFVEGDVVQVAVFQLLEPAEAAAVAADRRVFDLAEAIVARCLLDHTETVLANPACPAGLRDRVRYPYDAVTLELAVRAGVRHFEVAKVRRLLDQLDDREHRRYMELLRRPYLRARQACGLNTLEALTTGRLADLDLSDRDTAEAALGTPDTWHWRRLTDQVADVLIGHPQAADLVWTITEGRPVVHLDIARHIVRTARPEIARPVLRRCVPVEHLEAQDAPVALACDDYWTARCPGVPAAARPATRIPTVHEWLADRATWRDDEDEHGPWPIGNKASDDRFEYPEVIEGLQRPYPEAPGWTVTLPEAPTALAANADAMRNCTDTYAGAIEAGRTFIVIVEDPEGRRYNAAVDRSRASSGPRYRVGEVNSWANQGACPSWIGPAINARLDAGVCSFEPPEPPERRRRTASRRRARRAMQARQRRR